MLNDRPDMAYAQSITTPMSDATSYSPPLYDAPAPHPTPGYANSITPAKKGSLGWCLQHFSGGAFPTSGNKYIRTRWLNDFAAWCHSQQVPLSQVLGYVCEIADPVFKAEDALKVVGAAYRHEYTRHQSANPAQHAADLIIIKRINELGGWTLPQPLDSTLLPVMAFDESLLPTPLRPALTDLAHRMQSPPEWLAITMLTAAGAVVSARCGIYPKQYDTSWLEVPNLWGAIVAEPSQMKTPTINAATAPLRKLEQEAEQAFHRAMHEYEAEAELLKVRREALKGRIKAAYKAEDEQQLAEAKSELTSIGDGSPPHWRRYLVNDSTVEKLTELLGEHSPGILVMRDELTGLLQTWEKPGHENDRAFYLEGWSGTSSYTSDRIGRGTTRVTHCCLSLFGGIQPDKIASYLAQSLRGQNDGLLQRFQLLAWPDPRPYRYVDAAPDLAAQAQALALFKRLDELDFATCGATFYEGRSIPGFHFTSEAQTYFVEWLTEHEERLRTSGDSPALTQHLAKYRKLLPALALLLHLLDLANDGTAGSVSLEAVQRAAQWCTFLETHARRLYGYRGGAAGSTTALAAKLKADLLPDTFNARSVVRKGWQNLSETRVVEEAIAELVDAGWLREVSLPLKEGVGRPPAPKYQINPRIILFSSI